MVKESLLDAHAVVMELIFDPIDHDGPPESLPAAPSLEHGEEAANEVQGGGFPDQVIVGAGKIGQVLLDVSGLFADRLEHFLLESMANALSPLDTRKSTRSKTGCELPILGRWSS